MRWEDFRQSENIDDRRGDGGGGGMGLPIPGGGSGLGIGTIIVLGILGWAIGVDPRMLISGAEMVAGGRAPTSGYTEQQRPRQSAPPSDNTGRFVSAVVAMNEDVWKDVLPQQAGVRWRAPTLVMFDRVTTSACGTAQSAMGPFYCPADQKVYLDTSFFAYVVAHEVGHHIQTITGTSNQVRQAQARASEAEGNALQVRMELQADCYAGVWAARARTNDGQSVIEPGDFEEAMRAAQAIGDDTLMRNAGQRPVPESFTHGTSEQRMRWLRRGLETGDPAQCDTFAARVL